MAEQFKREVASGQMFHVATKAHRLLHDDPEASLPPEGMVVGLASYHDGVALTVAIITEDGTGSIAMLNQDMFISLLEALDEKNGELLALVGCQCEDCRAAAKAN